MNMYIRALFILFSVLLLSTTSSASSAKIVTDTLYSSSKKDWVIVSYQISREDSRITVSFMSARKILGESITKKYKKLDEIDIVFFDKTGVYRDMRFDGMTPKAFMISRNEMDYTKSSDGYFIIKQNPSLALTIKSDEVKTLNIPIFLAHHEKKGVYTIFDQCDDLKIVFPNINIRRTRQDLISKQTTSQVITTTEELGNEAFDYEYEALGLLNHINELLTKMELTDREISDLDESASKLRNHSYKQFSNKELEAKVKKTLSDYDERRAYLDEQVKSKEEAAIKEAEEKARLVAEEEKARQVSIAHAAQIKADEEKERNTWMIIGGIALAVLGFGGNQVLQHFRNKKNQENIKKMQDSVVKQAEAEAKRRARGFAKEQKNQAKNALINKSGKPVKSI